MNIIFFVSSSVNAFFMENTRYFTKYDIFMQKNPYICIFHALSFFYLLQIKLSTMRFAASSASGFPVKFVSCTRQ